MDHIILMLALRNLARLVSGSELAGPNRLVLKSTWAPRAHTQLTWHINSIYVLPGLHEHILIYKDFLRNKSGDKLEDEVGPEMVRAYKLFDLNIKSAIYYVTKGKKLTPQAIADLYAVKHNEEAVDQWFEDYVERKIRRCLPDFSLSNLYTILNTYKGKDSPIATQIIKELNSRNLNIQETV